MEFKFEYICCKNDYNVFAFSCPGCGTEGELGIPRHSQEIVKHECGALFKQTMPRGIFGKPVLEVIWVPKQKATGRSV